jgi:pyruvate, orthophosphate dikinase
MMYSDVVMEKAAGIEPEEDQGIRQQLEKLMDELKKPRATTDTDITAEDLKDLVRTVQGQGQGGARQAFPDDPMEQLWGGIGAVFASWNGKRAISYRRIEGIPDDWGTAVNVQAMVFGNMGDDSATGVAFTRNPATGENNFYGEYLVNAQGEDVVAGTRTPNPSTRNQERAQQAPGHPRKGDAQAVQGAGCDHPQRLEKHYRDMQDIEFTIEGGRLWMLQCRIGKRNGPAAIRMAMDDAGQGPHHQRTRAACQARISARRAAAPDHRPEGREEPRPGQGSAGRSRRRHRPDRLHGRRCRRKWARTARKSSWSAKRPTPRTSKACGRRSPSSPPRRHDQSRGAGRPRLGQVLHRRLQALHVDVTKKEVHVDGKVLKEGDWITLNGTKGNVYVGQLP